MDHGCDWLITINTVTLDSTFSRCVGVWLSVSKPWLNVDNWKRASAVQVILYKSSGDHELYIGITPLIRRAVNTGRTSLEDFGRVKLGTCQYRMYVRVCCKPRYTSIWIYTSLCSAGVCIDARQLCTYTNTYVSRYAKTRIAYVESVPKLVAPQNILISILQ